LGSPNAATVCFLLLQHNEQFGIKTVMSIRVWMDDDEHWNMCYKIGVPDDKANPMVGKRGAVRARL